MTLRRVLGSACLLFTCLYSSGSLAHAKIDTVALYNGDRLTGEIENLYGGRLSLNTDAIGRVFIEWQEISALDSPFHYEVRLSSGQRHFGTLSRGERPGLLRISSDAGDQEFEWLTVVELRAVELSWKDRIDAELSMGYSYTKATSVQQATLRGSVSYEDRHSIMLLTGRLTQSDSDNEELSRSSKVNLTRRNWSKRSNRTERYRQLYGDYEQNDELGLDSRYVLGAGIGRYWIDRHGLRIASTAGLQGATESPQEGSHAESLELAFSLDLSAWRFRDPELDLDFKLAVFPSVTEEGRTRGTTEFILKWELIEDFFWDVSAWGSFDNRAESGGELDYGVSTGVGWSY